MHFYKKGLAAGIPIALGYLSVSFTFGIIAVSEGFSWWQAVLISMTCLTSAGQFSGIHTMLIPGAYLDMLLSQFTINIRYSFMSVSLSQKADDRLRGIWRWIFGFFITDEIFAVGVTEDSVSRSYMAGLSTLPYLGWTGGTLLGALFGSILPERIMVALSIAIYGMFVAIVVPELKKNRDVILVVAVAAAASCVMTYVPGLSRLSPGISISIASVVAALVGALIHPVREEAAEDGC